MKFTKDQIDQMFSAPKNIKFTIISNQHPQIAPNDGGYVSTPFDRLSVMRVLTEPAMLRDPDNSSCFGPPVRELSASDRKLALILYPPKPPDVRPSSQQPQLAVRFEGALAADHFGYVLSALYEREKISLRKHVSSTQETVGDIIEAEKLAPRGKVLEGLENFLCRVNRHICRTVNGKAVWSNARATVNYADDGKSCGDLTLPKFVVCIPNIRLVPYPLVTTIEYDGRRDSLPQIVVSKLRGCDAWNDACRSIIRALNHQYDSIFVPETSQLLPATFAGSLRLLSEGYRLIVDYTYEKYRVSVEDAINDVLETRARQLKIPKSSMAVAITYQVGKPQAEAWAWGMEPVKGYIDPLKIMSFPYLDEQSEQQLNALRRVHVGIWDFRVDAEHCDLDGHPSPASVSHIVYSMLLEAPLLAQGNRLGPPPVKATQCGELHPQDYHMHLRYDHGTAIAGILAAPVNSRGIAGILPGMKIWAYEVVDGAQFGVGDPTILLAQKYPDLNPGTINISQTYPINPELTTQTNLFRIMFGEGQNAGIHNNMLLVAAAGRRITQEGKNVGIRLDDSTSTECNFYPACWSDTSHVRSLISVVALNSRGDGILEDDPGVPASNHGLAFDVAAVGEVVTTFHGDWTGMMRGTSIATPYVSGLAALLQAKLSPLHRGWDPWEVKQRILFTTDEPPSMRGLSRFGRINFASALAFEQDRFQYKPTLTCPRDSCLMTARLQRNIREWLTIRNGMEGDDPLPEKTILLANVRRIRSEGENLFTVIFVEGKLLKIIRGASISAGEKPVVQAETGNMVPFGTTGLLDYTSCSFAPACR
jgi:hypothetical protein